MIQTIGHCGAAFLEPENTIRGFRKAIEIGVDMIGSNRPDLLVKVLG